MVTSFFCEQAVYETHIYYYIFLVWPQSRTGVCQDIGHGLCWTSRPLCLGKGERFLPAPLRRLPLSPLQLRVWSEQVSLSSVLSPKRASFVTFDPEADGADEACTPKMHSAVLLFSALDCSILLVERTAVWDAMNVPPTASVPASCPALFWDFDRNENGRESHFVL